MEKPSLYLKIAYTIL